MKKLFILASTTLLAGMLYSADVSTVTVIMTGGLSSEGELITAGAQRRFQIDLNTETFNSLAQKIYDSNFFRNYPLHDQVISAFMWGPFKNTKIHEGADFSKLRDAGIRSGDAIRIGTEPVTQNP